VPPEDLKADLAQFVTFAQTLKGDEKSEAQSFLDQFFRALGHKSAIEAGATFEFRVAKKPGSPQIELVVAKNRDAGPAPRAKGGKKFADLLWPDRVLIEMKSRGEKLERHYDKLFEYWSHIVPKRPPYAILCNFDEFWIYDFNTQLFDPVDRIRLTQLPESWRAFGYMLPHKHEPKFDNNRVEVTRRAADLMARVFREVVFRGEDPQRSQRFILQLLVAMVAEDIGLLPADIVTDLLFDCSEKNENSYDLFGGLFRQMQSKEPARGGRFQDVQYFNGGLFEAVDPIELKRPELYALYEAAAHNDWSKVRPEIFGTLFQSSMDKRARHAYGAHFTSEFDVRKVVGPTIVKPWRGRIDAAGKDVPALRKALADLRAFRVLDPACGSGEFLFVAYREMKRLERDILVRLKKLRAHEGLTSTITLKNFFGIDLLEVAVEIAKVTMMLARELEIIEAAKLGESEGLFVHEHPLPLDNLSENIICADALFTDWPKADAIIGNPPFQSKNKIQRELGPDYIGSVRKLFPDVPGRADYCVYWLRKAHDQIPRGRYVGLVGTNTIRQNYSREGGLDYIVANGGTITEAVSSQPWSGEANVHVSIVNWMKGDVAGLKKLSLQTGNDPQGPVQSWLLGRINSSLSPDIDVTKAVRLKTNIQSKRCFQGQTHGHEAFLLNATEAREFIKRDTRNAEIIYPYLTIDELLSENDPTSRRFVIDFGSRDVLEAASYALVFDRIKSYVLPQRQKAANEEERRNDKTLKKDRKARVNHHHANFLKHWWRLSYPRPELIDQLQAIDRYISCGQVTKRPIFEFVSSKIRPNAALIVFPMEDDYSFGVLQSLIHWSWFTTKGSTLTERYRYTSDTVFDTFPWPQKPTGRDIKAIAEEAVALRGLRRDRMRKLNYSLRQLYRTLEEPGENPLRDAQAKLDAAVRAAYGMRDDADPLAFLLELNLACAAKEKAGEEITSPGLPLPAEEHSRFISDDCIQPPV
jgi:hypothetical protein